jgi:hypothetical protein
VKNKIKEPDFIGGKSPLTKKEEVALSKHFVKKKDIRKKKENHKKNL